MRWLPRALLMSASTLSLLIAACAGQATTSAPTTAPPTGPASPAAGAAQPGAASPTAKAPAAASPAAKSASPAAGAATNEAAANIPDFDTRFADLIAKAKQEGSLMVYHTTVDAGQADYNAKFEQRFPGVKLERFRAPAGPLHERYRTESRAGRGVADIIYASNLSLMKGLVDENLIANYTPAAAPAYPADLKIEGYGYPFYIIRIGSVLYNTDLVNEADAAKLMTWEGVLDPQWKGSILLTNPATAGSQVPLIHMFMEGLPQRFGRPFLDKLAAQNPTVLDSAATGSQRVAAGEFAVQVGSADEIVAPLHRNNAPVRLVFPPPTPVGPQVVAVTANAPHPNAARLFMEWSLSAEGQAAHAGSIGPSYLRSVPNPNPITQESWWKEPTELYIPPADAEAGAQSLTTEWKQIFGVQ